MILGFVLGAIANLGVVLWAWELSGKMAEEREHLRLPVFFVVRLTLISSLVLVSGAVGLFKPSFLALLGGMAALLFLVMRRKGLDLLMRVDVSSAMTWILGIMAFRLLAQALLVPSYHPDVNSYHLVKLAGWVKTGSIWATVGPDPRAWWPGGFELVEAWWVVFPRHDILMGLAGFEFLALGCSSAYALGTELGLEEKSAWISAAAFATIPGITLQTTAFMNDGPVASVVLSAFLFAVSGARWSLLALAIGLGAGLKATAVFGCAGAVFLLFLRRRNIEERPVGVILGALAVLTGSVWYVRNLVVHQNPFYPVGTGLLEPWIGSTQTASISGMKLLSNLGLFLERLLDGQQSLSPVLRYSAGWGAAAIAFGLPGLVAGLRATGPWRALFASSLVSVAATLLIVQPDQYFLRFVFFMPALLSVGVGRLVEEVPELRKLVVAVLLFNVVSTVFTEDLPLGQYRKFADRSLNERPWSWGWEDVAAERVGSLAGANGNAYLLYRRDLSRDVVHLDPGNADQLESMMRRERLYFLYSTNDSERIHKVLSEALSRSILFRFQERWYVLRPDQENYSLKPSIPPPK